MYQFEINMAPVPASRPRVSKRGTYYPEKYSRFKTKLKEYLKSLKLEPLDGALGLEVEFHMEIPKSLSQKKQKELNGKYHTKKPDQDNLLKSVMDGMNEIIYKDDAAICDMRGKKLYSDKPRICVKIWVIEG